MLINSVQINVLKAARYVSGFHHFARSMKFPGITPTTNAGAVNIHDCRVIAAPMGATK
jgi:hypothetical protein